MRPFAFKAARSYFGIALLLTAMWATSFIATYLLPAAIVALVASMLFAGAGFLWHKPRKSTGQSSSVSSPALNAPTPTSIEAKAGE